MPLFRKKPVTIQAHQWFRNGDHPDDFSDRDNGDGRMSREGMVVRYHPERESASPCEMCGKEMRAHGWVNTLEAGHRVCPGDWIITGVQGERYPCKPDIFELTYEPALNTEV